MDSEFDQPRLGSVAGIIEHLDSDFHVLPPMTNFPYPTVGHESFGICAVVPFENVAVYNPDTNSWLAPNRIHPEQMFEEITLELAAAAKAPHDRVTTLVWFVKGVGAQSVEHPDYLVVGANPEDAAAAVKNLMSRRLTGSTEPVSSWLGRYAAAAIGGSRERISGDVIRFISSLEFSLNRLVGKEEMICYGHPLRVADLVDPSFMLPAIAVAAYEDWQLAANMKPTGSGFTINLQSDPTALLGYRLTHIEPAIPLTALAPIVAVARRSKQGDIFAFEDVVRQFVAWLQKNNRDPGVLDNIEIRMASGI